MKCEELWNLFKNEKFVFFTGVPDSTFKPWMSFLDKKDGKGLQNIIACNECEAVAIATGYHLATGEIGTVYMQNSGLGKAVNPLTSLTDSEVYSIPILLMIGWRGEPNIKDAPQHKKMGRITLPLLELLEIPYFILPKKIENVKRQLQKAKKYLLEKSSPFAIVIRKDKIEPNKDKEIQNNNYDITREKALEIILNNLEPDTKIISTTGKVSRELFELRKRRGESPSDFYTVGSMGCSSSIALGYALNSERKTVVIDGDGSLIMQMGTLATIGYYKPNHFYHIVIDNHSHDSTGGQPTVSKRIDFREIALGNAYNYVKTVKSNDEIKLGLKELFSSKGPSMLIIKVNKGSRNNLGRPPISPTQIKLNFMK